MSLNRPSVTRNSPCQARDSPPPHVARILKLSSCLRGLAGVSASAAADAVGFDPKGTRRAPPKRSRKLRPRLSGSWDLVRLARGRHAEIRTIISRPMRRVARPTDPWRFAHQPRVRSETTTAAEPSSVAEALGRASVAKSLAFCGRPCPNMLFKRVCSRRDCAALACPRGLRSRGSIAKSEKSELWQFWERWLQSEDDVWGNCGGLDVWVK